MHAYPLVRVCLAFALLSVATHNGPASSVALAWEGSSANDVIAYRVYYGTSSGTYQGSIYVSNSTSSQLAGLTGSTTYYFVVTALSWAGVESAPSNEVNFMTAPNQAPVVSLVSPAAGTYYRSSGSISMSASASDPDGSISRVEFYANSVKIGQATSAPYSFNWQRVPVGNYTLTAIAYDDSGASTTSAQVPITVGSTTMVRPSVSVSANPTIIRAGSTAAFRIYMSRTRPIATTISYQMLGTAVRGTHYSIDGTGQLTIPAGATSGVVTMTTYPNTITSNKVTAALQIVSSGDYKASKRAATVTILP